MAVYTQLQKKDLELYLQNYSIGSLVNYEGILEGIENSNFKVETSKGIYILTIFEKRVNIDDVPFFMELQKYLANNGFNCPIPIEDNKKSIINNIKDKKAILISFIQGKKISIVTPEICEQVGKMMANFRKITLSFKGFRENSLNLKNLEKIFNNFVNEKKHGYKDCFYNMKNEFNFLIKKYPINLPAGIIHADLFQDNIFFKEKKLHGVIDFYFSCYDYYTYELAIATNAWCFDNLQNLKEENFNSLIKGYISNLKLLDEEKRNFNILLRVAAMRILVTRLHDNLFQAKNAIVVPKEPLEYFNILKWHQENELCIND